MKQWCATVLLGVVVLVGDAEAATGLTPLSDRGKVNCLETCVDVWELKCPTGATILDVDLYDYLGASDNERFMALLTGVAPTALYGKTDADWAQGTVGSFPFLARGSVGSIKALLNIIAINPTNTEKDYQLTMRCLGSGGSLKNGSMILKQNQ